MIGLGNPFAIAIEILGVTTMAIIVVLLATGPREFDQRYEASKPER